MTKHKIFISRGNCHQAAPGLLKTGLLKRVIRQSALISGLMLVGISTSYATPLEQAKRMHDRLAGIPPSNEMLCAMEYLIDPAGAGDPVQAAYLVMSLNPATDANVPDFTNIPAGCGTVDNSASRKAFYSISLKDYFTPWTNAAKSKHAPLNDATATLIGMVRDEVPFNTALSADIVYVPNGQSYNGSSNAQYETLESNNADLSDSTVLDITSQSTLPPAARAGLFSLRGTGEAFYSAGTNRRMIDYMMFNFICNGLLSSAAELSDATRPADRILQDTSRSPGGDSAVYLNQCIGCHAGMDPFKGGLAYYDWDEMDPNDDTDGQVDYDSSAPQPKFLQNETVFPAGYVTTDDGWLNYWREGSNERLEWGWDTSLGAVANDSNPDETDRVTSGRGAQSFGIEIASTKAFAQCQVERAYEHVCLQSPTAPDQAALQTTLNALVESFANRSSGTDKYNLKKVFANVAPLCMGD